jgi:hypothetical protein
MVPLRSGSLTKTHPNPGLSRVARIPVEHDVLRADHQRMQPWVHLPASPGEGDGQQLT